MTTDKFTSQTDEPQNGPGTENDSGELATQSTEPSELAASLDAARAEAAEWRDKYVRLLAEFDNFRKRLRQDLEMQRNLTSEILLSSLLPVMDDMDRMLSTAADSNDPYRRGAELIRDKMRSYLQSQGVERMESVGRPFDPMEHDALMLKPTMDFPAGTVLEVITPGYRMGDRVIRHAQVVVSEPAQTEPPTNPVLP